MRVANMKRIEGAIGRLLTNAEELVHRGFGPDKIRAELENLFREMDEESRTVGRI